MPRKLRRVRLPRTQCSEDYQVCTNCTAVVWAWGASGTCIQLPENCEWGGGADGQCTTCGYGELREA